MNKKLKGLLSLWLAVIMVFSIMAVPAVAATWSDVQIGTQPTGDRPVVSAQIKEDGGDWQWVYAVEPSAVTYQWYEVVSGAAYPVDGQTTDTLTAGSHYAWYLCKITLDGTTIDSNEFQFDKGAYPIDYLPGEYGVGDPVRDFKIHDEDITLSSAIFTRDGYKQTGWKIRGVDGEVALNSIYTTNAAATLYPVWTARTGVFIGANELSVGEYYKVDSNVIGGGDASDYNALLTFTNGADASYGYTLTINGLEYTSPGLIPAISSTGADLTLVLVGDNTVTGGAGTNSLGIYAVQDLTIMGDGKLTATGGAGTNSFGIGVGGDIVIENGDVTAYGGTAAGGSSFGIGSTGNITISGGTVDATGGDATGDNVNSFGIGVDGKITISGNAEVNAVGGDAKANTSIMRTAFRMSRSAGSGRNSFGIGSKNGIDISGDAAVNALGGEAGNSFGMGSNGGISIGGNADVEANGDNADQNSFGVGADGAISISGNADLDAASGEANENSIGLGSKLNFSMSGGNATMLGGNACLCSAGIITGGSVTLNNGKLNANGGNSSGVGGDADSNKNSYGIGSEGNITIGDNGEVNANAGNAENGSSYGVGALGNVTINGKLDANGGEAAGDSFGIGSEGKVTIDSSENVDAAGGTAGTDEYSGGIGALSGIEINSTLVDLSGNSWAVGAQSGGVDITLGDKEAFTDGNKVSNLDNVIWSEVKRLEIRLASGGGRPSGGGGRPAHSCSSKCDICGGCEDLKCGYTACKDKCLLLTMDFDDVSEADWFHEAVGYVYHHGIMDGVSENKFDPYGSTTRAMIVATIWRMEGEPVVNYLMGFEDVEAETWYTEAVRWAAAEGIVDGYSDTEFGPCDPITREQMVAILWRYAKHEGIDVSAGEDTIPGFSDASDVKEYAVPAMKWACAEGIISGRVSGKLEPAAPSMRCEIAQMLMNFCLLG